MKIVYFTHSLASCWNHGNAHFLRGVLRELIAMGHQVNAYEPKGAWSLENLLKDHGEEGLEAWTVPELWLMGAPQERIDHVVDITDVLDRKVAALRAHASQTAHIDDLPGRLREWGGGWARRFGLPAGRVAEAFQVASIG